MGRARKKGRASALPGQTMLYALATLLLAGTMGGVLYGIEGEILVPIGAIALLIYLFVELRAWWRRGMAPGRMEATFGCLGLLCGVPAYYFVDIFPVFAASLAGFFICFILVFVAQIWGQSRKTKRLYVEWQATRAERHKEENA